MEKIRRAEAKIVPSLADLSYKEKLAKLRLISLKERRERSNVGAVFRAVMAVDNVIRGCPI